jgi:hypothetical protein
MALPHRRTKEQSHEHHEQRKEAPQAYERILAGAQKDRPFIENRGAWAAH